MGDVGGSKDMELRRNSTYFVPMFGFGTPIAEMKDHGRLSQGGLDETVGV
jgi:hypothetical protein